jgi:hypothetical protein
MTLVQQDGLELFRQRLSEDRFLAVLVTTRPSVADPQVSVVNASVIDHPVDGRPVVAFVARRGAKLANLRVNGRATLVARAGWEWVAVRGAVELSGPDDPHPSFDPEAQRRLLRSIYEAAGGRHPDLSEYDRVMLDERRCAVLVHPERIWTNPPASQHREP